MHGGESGIIYRLLSGDYEKLMKMTYNDLRHQEVLPADRYDITGLTVVLEGETYQLESRGRIRTGNGHAQERRRILRPFWMHCWPWRQKVLQRKRPLGRRRSG